MNHHIISTGNGTGATFTNKQHALDYQKTYGGTYILLNRLPDRIPPKAQPKATPVEGAINMKDSSIIKDRSIIVYTDGSCPINPGLGGYGVVIVESDGSTTELSQGYGYTNNI